jgi:hypothetical protein
MISEIWKDIPGYEGFYQASDLGRIKSLAIENGKNSLAKQTRILKNVLNEHGYCYVTLAKDKIHKKYKVHRLVLCAFVNQSSLDCNHKNGIKSDNRLVNLEYCTRSENEKHAYRIGLKSNKEELHSQAKLTNNQVKRLRFIYQFYEVELGYWSKLAKALNITPQHLSRIITNKSRCAA